MLYSEIIAVCSQIHTKHINTLCGQNVEIVNVKTWWYLKVTSGLKMVNGQGGVTFSSYCAEVGLFLDRCHMKPP
jgi:hypothetical protein